MPERKIAKDAMLTPTCFRDRSSDFSATLKPKSAIFTTVFALFMRTKEAVKFGQLMNTTQATILTVW